MPAWRHAPTVVTAQSLPSLPILIEKEPRARRPAARPAVPARQPGPRSLGLLRLPILLSLLSLLSLGSWLSCNPPPARTQNPSTLWVGFGQTELDLVLTDSEPPYY